MEEIDGIVDTATHEHFELPPEPKKNHRMLCDWVGNRRPGGK